MDIKQAIIWVIIIGIGSFLIIRHQSSFPIPEGETMPLENESMASKEISEGNDRTKTVKEVQESTRKVFVTDGTKHSIPLDEIRRGCFGRDCIPSVDDPEHIGTKEANSLLPDDTIGIGLEYKGSKRFYPFNMLVTREIVNDELEGDALAVTYCPLCGTGVVYSREIGGRTLEFGVSGMLWQSNLLMYNRESNEEDISLWSQVLGEAVLGPDTGTKLEIIPSDIVRYTDWQAQNPDGEVLNTGRIGDPYGGNYYGVARSFNPDFDEATSELPPTAYVSGIEIDGEFKAYHNEALDEGTTNDRFAREDLVIEKSDIGEIRVHKKDSGEPVSVISGFWFSWVAAHPDTELYK